MDIKRRLPLLSLAILVSLGAAAAAPSAAAQDVPPLEPAPRDQLPPPQAKWKLILAGTGTTAGFYGLAAGVSYLSPDSPISDELRIPVLGPWMALGDVGCGADPSCTTFNVVLRTIFSVLDGVGQAGGLLMVAEGIFLPTADASPSHDAPRRRRPKPTPAKQIFLAPSPIGVGGIGLGVSGTF